MVAGSALGWTSFAVLGVLLVAACASDVRSRRIPNTLVGTTALAGTILSAVSGPGLHGIMLALSGFGVGLMLWLPFFAFRMLGAGDVKLFAAAATFLGPRGAIEAAALTAFYGAVLAAGFMIANSGLPATLVRLAHSVEMPSLLKQDPGKIRYKLPYAVAIACGVATAFWWPGHILG